MKIASNRTLCYRLTHQKKKQIKIEPQGEKKFLSYATKRASFSSRPMQAFVSWDLHESVQGHASLIIILKKAVNKEWSYLKLVSLAQEKKDSLPFNIFVQLLFLGFERNLNYPPPPPDLFEDGKIVAAHPSAAITN